MKINKRTVLVGLIGSGMTKSCLSYLPGPWSVASAICTCQCSDWAQVKFEMSAPDLDSTKKAQQYDLNFTLLLIGDAGVGKTSLVWYYADKHSCDPKKKIPTIGKFFLFVCLFVCLLVWVGFFLPARYVTRQLNYRKLESIRVANFRVINFHVKIFCRSGRATKIF